MVTDTLKAPFPYFGGKSAVADMVWQRFGDVPNYVEPFFGSGAILLGRPHAPGIETVNDADGLLSNFWRALQADPDAVAGYADWPINENDVHGRHAWLVGQKDSLQARLEGDPDYYDAKIAGWWVWGMSCWIGSGFCSGDGPWHVVDGEMVNTGGGAGQGVKRKRPHLSDAGQGVNRQRLHLSDAGQGVKRKLPHLGDAGRGVNRQLPHLGNYGKGVNRQLPHLRDYMRALSDRLRSVRVCCGDWSRVTGEAVMFPGPKLVAVFLDPPYADTANRDSNLYRVDSLSVAHDVREWAIAHGNDKRYRIALCGYDGEHAMPDDWECIAGKGGGGKGYGGQSKSGYSNAGRERIWFSPHCLRPQAQLALFA